MARYEHLPIFADSYRLALLIEQQVAAFPNRLQSGSGSDLRSQVRLMSRLIMSANNTQVRLPFLERFGDSVKHVTSKLLKMSQN